MVCLTSNNSHHHLACFKTTLSSSRFDGSSYHASARTLRFADSPLKAAAVVSMLCFAGLLYTVKRYNHRRTAAAFARVCCLSECCRRMKGRRERRVYAPKARGRMVMSMKARIAKKRTGFMPLPERPSQYAAEAAFAARKHIVNSGGLTAHRQGFS